MATRMQQRRGTAAQWTSANPVLAAGEIGFEIDTYKFKIGDGINQWGDLDYFGASDDVLANLIDGAPEALDTLNELAAAIGDDPAFANAVLTHTDATLGVHGIANTEALLTIAHAAETSNVHGIANTLALATLNEVENFRTNAIAEAESYTNTEIIAHNALTENVHGISNTLVLATKEYVANAAGSGLQWNSGTEEFELDSTIATEEYATNAIADHNALTENVHGIANTLVLATLTDVSNAQTAAEAYADSLAPNYDPVGSAANAEAYADSQIDAHVAVTTNVHGIADTSDIMLKSANAQTLSGDLTVTGDLIVSGNTTTVSAQDLIVTDPLIYIAEGNDANLVDVGIVGSFDDGTYQHTGIVRDSSASIWKLFKGVTDEPTTTINFGQGSLDDLAVNNIEVAGVVFTDGTQSKEGVPSRTTIHQKTASYELSSVDERDDLIEMNSASGITLTIPTDANTNFPIGTSIDVVQTGSGQVTIAGDAGVTVNATPGLKLRAQWSTATLFKRAADTWLVMGDLSA